MFNPYPYNDPDAVNRIENNGNIDLSGIYNGNRQIAAAFAGLSGKIIAIDGYATSPVATVCGLFPKNCRFIDTASLFRSPSDTEKLLSDNLPCDREKDPVLLYGRLFEGGYEALFDPEKLSALCNWLEAGHDGVTVICGNGALCDTLRRYADVRIYTDVTPKKAVLNVKAGGYRNFGSSSDLPFRETMRRCYYVDFWLGFRLRAGLLAGRELDYYICGDDPTDMKMFTEDALHSLVMRTLDYPIRQRPVYLEGVWGGYYVKKERHLPDAMKNCAWVFDMIPMEVSTAVILDGREYEFPFYVFVAAGGEKLMGKKCLEEYRGLFPIRFNYDDTFHSAGNMSIQLHPGEKFVTENHGEPGRQDESYYIVNVGQGARTYLGFNRGIDPEEFIAEAKRSEKEHTPIDYRHYIHSVKSEPGIQVMIPAGTIHGSGQNQLILEIGSLTVGSYTYKMYDYLRKDLDGKPRPIHSYFGEINLNRGITEEYAETHLVNGGYRVIRSGDGWSETVVGECPELYFSLRNLKFTDSVTDSANGDFHVLALVDGESVTVRSVCDHSLKFDMDYLDIVVVPASFGEYEIVNNKPGTWITVHKTLLRR